MNNIYIEALRPSSLLREIENGVALTVLGAGKGVAFVAKGTARRTKRFAHDVRVEYRARQRLALQAGLRKQLDDYQRLSPAAKAAHILEQMEVERRYAELSASREVPITNE